MGARGIFRPLRAINPRGYYAGRALLRALRIGVLAKGPERRKPIIDKSRVLALLRCTVHFIPISVSACLLAFNLSKYFIGAELEGWQGFKDLKFSAIQLAAKIQEVLIVASLTTIVLHVLKYQLLFGDGLPLGLMGSQISFTQITYFWSPEFWSVFSYKTGTRRSRFNRLAVIILLVVCGILALLSGPVTAILMIPREKDWLMGGSHFWLNGSEHDLWPIRLEDDDRFAYLPCNTTRDHLWNPACPSAGYRALHNYMSTKPSITGTGSLHFELHDNTIRKAVYASIPYNDAHLPTVDTWSFSTHYPSATILEALQALHIECLNWYQTYKPKSFGLRAWSFGLASKIRSAVVGKIPAVRVACMNAESYSNYSSYIYDPSESTMEVPFMNFIEYEPGWWLTEEDARPSPVRYYDVADTMRDGLLSRGLISRNDNETWQWSPNTPTFIVIPIAIENAPSVNTMAVLVISRERQDEGDPQWVMATCSVDARWASAMLYIEAKRPERPLRYDFRAARGRNIARTELISKTSIELGYRFFHPENDGTWETIEMRPSWFNRLAPVIPTSEMPPLPGQIVQVPQTTVESLLEAMRPDSYWNKHYISHRKIRRDLTRIEHVLATTISDGISRSGLHLNLDNTHGLPDVSHSDVSTEEEAQSMFHHGEPYDKVSRPAYFQGKNSTEMIMRTYFTGYGLAARSWFDFFCVGVLILHAVMALGHTMWVLAYGSSSDAWDTVPDLVGLSLTSEPPRDECLENTCAGIRSSKSVSQVVWLESQIGDSGPGTEELAFRVGEVRTSSLKPGGIIGRKFGSRASGNIDSDTATLL